jgi:DNA-binding transcriptional ArsR family regulator
MSKRNGTGIALLADPTRLRIVQLLAQHPMRPSIIAREVGLSRPAMSRHLRLLQEAGLVCHLIGPHDGRVRLFSLNADNAKRVRAFLEATELGLRPAPSSAPRRWDIDPWDS